MDFRNDPKLRGMADRVSSQITNPSQHHSSPPSSGLSLPPRPGNVVPPGVGTTLETAPTNPPQNITQYFQQTKDDISSQGKKKQLIVAGICAGFVFLFCFIFLVSMKPGFVVKKTYENGVEKKSTKFFTIFIISTVLAAIVAILGLVSFLKK